MLATWLLWQRIIVMIFVQFQMRASSRRSFLLPSRLYKLHNNSFLFFILAPRWLPFNGATITIKHVIFHRFLNGDNLLHFKIVLVLAREKEKRTAAFGKSLGFLEVVLCVLFAFFLKRSFETFWGCN